MSFQVGKQLSTSELFYAMLGYLVDSGYNIDSKVDFAKGQSTYPKTITLTNSKQTITLCGVMRDFATKTTRTTPLLGPVHDTENPATEYFYPIAETGTYLGRNVNHYVLAHKTYFYNANNSDAAEDSLLIYDSIQRNYDTRAISKKLKCKTTLPQPKKLNPFSGKQLLTDTWQCGHYVLRQLEMALKNNISPSSSVKFKNNRIPSFGTIAESKVSESEYFYAKGLGAYQKFSAKSEKPVVNEKTKELKSLKDSINLLVDSRINELKLEIERLEFNPIIKKLKLRRLTTLKKLIKLSPDKDSIKAHILTALNNKFLTRGVFSGLRGFNKTKKACSSRTEIMLNTIISSEAFKTTLQEDNEDTLDASDGFTHIS